MPVYGARRASNGRAQAAGPASSRLRRAPVSLLRVTELTFHDARPLPEPNPSDDAHTRRSGNGGPANPSGRWPNSGNSTRAAFAACATPASSGTSASAAGSASPATRCKKTFTRCSTPGSPRRVATRTRNGTHDPWRTFASAVPAAGRSPCTSAAANAAGFRCAALDGRPNGRQPAWKMTCNRERSSNPRRPPSGTTSSSGLKRTSASTTPRALTRTTAITTQRFLQPRLGHLKLTQLRPLHLQSLYVELRQQGHTRTADYVHQGGA